MRGDVPKSPTIAHLAAASSSGSAFDRGETRWNRRDVVIVSQMRARVSCISVSLVILAGGEGRRLGGPKALLRLDGRPILCAMLDRLSWSGPTVLSVSQRLRHAPGHERFDQILIDESSGASAAELIRSLSRRLNSAAVYLPVDIPLFSRERLEELIGALHSPDVVAAMFRRRGEIESLPLAASSDIARVLDSTLAAGNRSLRCLAGRADALVRDTDDDEISWTHLNDDADVLRSGLRISRAQEE
jgi:molybdopterin-guanine dinucleotide biosynthesis protein A